MSGWWNTELWTGDASAPESLLASVSTMGLQQPMTMVEFVPPVACGADFWVVMNCKSMGSGRPFPFADGTPNPVSHSFISSDGTTWEPFVLWESQTAVDFFFRAHGSIVMNLQGSTWGEIKGLFR